MDDVCATLMYALESRRHTLAIQAARELRVSGEAELLVNLVTLAWLLCPPAPVPPRAFPPTPATVFEALCALLDWFPAECPRYCPQLQVPLPAANDVTDHPPVLRWAHPSTFTPAQAAVLEHTVQACIRKNYQKQCVRLLTPLLHKHTASLQGLLQHVVGVSAHCTDLLGRLVYMPLAERLLMHIVADACCGSAAALADPAAAPTTTKHAHVWNSGLHGRAARTFHIPRAALQRWNIRPKSVERIQGTIVPRAATVPEAALCWQAAPLPPATDAEATERWFSAHFPDDIPDEWPCEEIQKSHFYDIAAGPGHDALVAAATDWVPAFLLCWS